MSRKRLEIHRAIWARKPVLAEVYSVWFELLLRAAPPAGLVVEVGSGPGLLSEVARQRRPDLKWIAADIVAAPWNDVVADAHRLPFRDVCADAVIGLDVIHHLATPAELFREAARLLKPGGRLAVVEPWVSPFSYWIYRLFHQERCSLRLSDPWHPFANASGAAKDAFDGDAAIVNSLVRSTSREQWRQLGFAPPDVQLLNAFAYLLSLGFREASLLPPWLLGPLRSVDEHSSAFGRLLAMRALVVWRKLPLDGAGEETHRESETTKTSAT